jgi:glutamyl-tRNA reductase
MPKLITWQSFMAIYVIGINHKTAPIEIRERAYFAPDKLGLYAQDLVNQTAAEEAVILSTCNRTEIYCDTSEVKSAINWFRAQTTLTQDEFEASVYIYHNESAIAHLMQVGSGLDSMIVGEPQILGQLKEAFTESCAMETVGSVFHRLFQSVFKVAKEIRSTTSIGACPVSVASAAVHFTKQQFLNKNDTRVALIGVGDTSQLLLRYLTAYLNYPICLVNRSLDNAKKLAEQFSVPITIASLDELDTILSDVDIVFSAVASPLPIINRDKMEKSITKRNKKPILLFDLAVPRNIHPDVSELSSVTLNCIDDLKLHIEHNRQGREHAAIKARELIDVKSKELVLELNSLNQVATTIKAYRGQIEEICRVELTKAKHQLNQGEDADKVLDVFADALIKKLLHTPSVQLRQAGMEGRLELLQLVQQLFAIPDSKGRVA